MEDKENPLAALNGEAGNEGAEDYKSKYEALEKDFQRERVEAGRLKKAQEEIARLKSENEKLSSRKREESILESLSEEDREDIPEDYQRGAARIAQAAIDQRESVLNERIAKLEEQLMASRGHGESMSRSDFAGQIEASYPGFLGSIGKGGDKYDAWMMYQRHNAPSIKAAYDSNDFETLAYHISNFYNNFLGISAPSGSFNATPDPRDTSGIPQSSFFGGKTYTSAEFSRILEKAQDDFQNQLISVTEYTKIKNELNNAFREGRVQ